MAQRVQKKASIKKAGKGENTQNHPSAKPVTDYKHSNKKRKNNPDAGAVTVASDPITSKTKTYKYDPNLDPSLQWAGKAEHTSFEVPTVSLHTHESIEPRSIIEAIYSNPAATQPALFENQANGLRPQKCAGDDEHKTSNALKGGELKNDAPKAPQSKQVTYYQHNKAWKNRLIAGDSLLVMNSLIEKEGLADGVQCIYIDPPYGIKYGSNFQPFVNKREVKDKKDEHLTAEPESIKAFRDTWQLGIHSYLNYMRDRLLLAKELLTESGSCFVQISDENVHLVRNVMDEVFGKDNYMSLISYRVKSPLGATFLGHTTDYILWFSKSKSSCKFNQLFVKKNEGSDSPFVWVEEQNGTRRKMTQDEQINPNILPKGARTFSYSSLQSSGRTESCVFEFKMNGKGYWPSGGVKSWKTTKTGMQSLLNSNRIYVPKNQPIYIYFHDDFPVSKLNNMWLNMGAPSDKKYIVQTSSKVIQRCILMTTDPGDIVLDPTCGSGTTAYVAEQWGRRWITCDTSRVAIALAKQRLMTANFDYYKLKDKNQGPEGGFDYKTVPHVTLGSIANNPDIKKGMTKQQIDAAIDKHAMHEVLYDKPHIDSSKVRVTGPFTVEAVPGGRVDPLSRETLNSTHGATRRAWLDELRRLGVRGKKGVSQNIEFNYLTLLNGTKHVYALGETKAEDSAKAHKVAVCFGSEYAPLEQSQIELALKEAQKFKPDLVVFCALQFDPEAGKKVDSFSNGMRVVKAQMNSDLFTHDLKKKQKGDDKFWLVGQPEVILHKINAGSNKGLYEAEVLGFDYYNTATNNVESGEVENIAMWMLDTNYDGLSVCPSQVFFPMAGVKDSWDRFKKILNTSIDKSQLDPFRGNRSQAFAPGKNKKIAVKIIDDRGIESLVVQAIK